MGRKLAGSAPREKLVAFRLNPDEVAERDRNMQRRGIAEISDYYRTLQREDGQS